MNLIIWLFGVILYFLSLCTASAEPVQIDAKQISQFLPDSNQTQFGKLTFLGGLELSSTHKHFGGISAARFDKAGRLIMITDKARVIMANLRRHDEKPIRLTKASITRLKNPNGRTITGAGQKDSESLEIIGSSYLIGFERNDRVLRFNRKGTILTGDRTFDVDLNNEDFPNNRGAEALAYSQQTNKLYVITEMAMDDHGNNKGYMIKDGNVVQKFAIKNSDGFSPTDAAFLDDGSMLLLERYYSPFTGVFMQMRRLSADTLNGDNPFDGELLIEANRHYEIDNMEALAVSRMADGATRLTIISDDNFANDQRTLLLEFKLN